MAVTFVIGRAGSGKTSRCFNRIVEAMRADPLGPPIYWILPRQATFTAERELTCASGLGGFTRARVLSFDMMAEDVFSACGGGAVPEVTPLGRQMILGHLLRRLQPRLSFFKSVARQPGVATELDATFAEMERAGKSSTDLAALLEEREPFADSEADPQALVPKLRDLRLLYDEYAAFLGQGRLDQHRRLMQVLECLQGHPLLPQSQVYVDGFYDFTDHDRRFLAGLGKVCRSVEITLPLDPQSPTVLNPHHLPDDLSVFHKTEQAYRRLWFTLEEAGVNIAEPVVLHEPARFRSLGITSIERGVFSPKSPPAKDAAGVEFVIAPDRRAEVDAVARRIGELAAEGHRLRDIAVIVRDLNDYQSHIEPSFREHGLAFFIDRRRTAAHHPLLQFVRSALQVARFDWPHDAVMSLLKTGLAGLGPDDVDRLENYVLDHRIVGSAWESPEPWMFRRDLTRPAAEEIEAETISDDAPTIDTLRRGIADRLRPLLDIVKPDISRTDTLRSLRDFAAAVFAAIEANHVRQTLQTWMTTSAASGDLEQHDEHQQVWAELVSLFDQMVELLGDEPMTLADFVDVLESGLERFDLALTPPTVDQVLIGQVDRVRTPPGLRVAFVMGLVEGEFPRAAQDSCILTDAERKALRRRQIDLDPDPRRRLLDERFLGYLAFTRASERLTLTRPASSEGSEPASPSPFWREVASLLPSIEPVEAPAEEANDARHIATPRQLVVGLARWIRSGQEANKTQEEAPKVEHASESVEQKWRPVEAAQPQHAKPPGPADATWRSLYHWISSHAPTGDAVDSIRYRVWRALSYTNDATLSPCLAAALFPAPLQATASRLETFAACPFRHFMRHGIRLIDRESESVTAIDLSRVYHQVLEQLVAQAIAEGRDWTGKAPITAQEIRDCAKQVGELLRGELMMSSARNRYLLDRIERALDQVVAGQCEAMRRGKFRPQRSGLSYGAKTGDVGALRLRTPGGAEVVLRGRIDRLDHLPDGKQVSLIDYRLGSHQLSLAEVYHGLSLQLLTGLLALQADGRKPAGAFYLQLVRHLGDVKHPDEATDPESPQFKLSVKPRGIFEAGALQDFDSDFSSGESEVVQVKINRDGGFAKRGSDAATAEAFDSLLAHVRTRLTQLADRLLAGEIGVNPYKINTQSPCPRCEFHGVCRFEPSINRYRYLNPLSREKALEKVIEEGRT